MNDPIFEDNDGEIFDEVGYSGWIDPYNQSTIYPINMIAIIEPKIKQWTLDSRIFTDAKDACLNAGRLFIFYSGVRVVKQNDKYFILYWSDKESICQ